MIHLREVKQYKDLKTFIKLPYKIHRNHKEWLPPLLTDEYKVFDKKKNHLFEKCETIMYLALKNGEVVGRIMGIINHTYNKGHNEKNVRFCYLECYDDSEVFMDMPDIEAYEIKEWETEPGDVVAFNFKTIHSANANLEKKMSRTLSFRLLGDDVVYNERPGRTSPSFPDINQQNGERLREDWFPTLCR